MRINRRQFLSSAAGGVALAALPRTVLSAKDDGFIELIAGPMKQKLHPSSPVRSDLWTYNNMTPGPEIRVSQGARVRVRLTNNLEEPTTVHWHGIRIDNRMDGVAGLTQDAVPPGETFDYEFVAPDAGTYWYHAHNKSWNQVARGLYGPLIVEEAEPTYDRDHDLTLVIDDWRLNSDGALDLSSLGSLMDWSHGGRLGNWMTVNGESLPTFDLRAGESYRLRLINASNSRVLELDPVKLGARVLAYDGQPLPAPTLLDYSPFLLGPAQRVDLLVVPDEDFALEEVSGDEPFAFAAFSVSVGAAEPEPVPTLPLNAIPEPDLSKAVTVRLNMTGGAMGGFTDIVYQGKKIEGEDFRRTRQVWAFNGVANLAEEPLFRASRGETIVLETVNDTGWVHAMHLHGHHFRVTERSGATVDEEQPWRDTFLIGPQQTTKIAFVADNPGMWLLHCHMLEHAAAGMNTWFEVG
ncbi:multicopper oxidase family protein [Oricola cellulosilytica]|uniref:Multicopper oxidase family protein n=1 Tax=Oricola cellulosilytica TaxID=1429082 RepID=A0A4R0PF46_9HYPH|nr:multicopper oxidase family protein [Oricola cellulosilytica]TCD15413.1 multicopper oxidase family protein [Oricola cellulosilytica]